MPGAGVGGMGSCLTLGTGFQFFRMKRVLLLEENIGKTFSDINHTNVFFGQSPKAIAIKTKINGT